MVTVEQCEEALGFKFAKWQRKLIESKAELIVVVKGRKSGGSRTVATKCVIMGMDEEEGHTLITAKTENAAKETFGYVAQLVRMLKIETLDERKLAVTLPNGHFIECLTAGPTGFALRPKSVTRLVISEAGFMTDEVHDAITPCLAVTGKQEIMESSPWDTSGFFFDAFGDEKADVYHISSENCPWVKKEYLKKEKQRMGPEIYRREYLAEFLRSTDALIPDKVLREALDENMNQFLVEKEATMIFLGVDFARFGKDDNAIVWCSYNPDTRKCIVYKTELIDSKHRLSYMVNKLESLARADSRIVRIVTDETGIGGGPTDALIERLGRRMIVGVSNQRRGDKDKGWRRKLIKSDMYTAAILAMEEQRLKICPDKKTIQSLRNLRYKYSGDADLQIKGRDDHIAEALVRSVWLPLSGQMKGYQQVYLVKM